LIQVEPRDLPRHELIGLGVRVTQHSNPFNVSISGLVVDETKNTLVIRHDSKNKRVEKRTGTFLFDLNGRNIEVDGRVLQGRPEDRVKRKVKRSW
jgi:ribonuclease P protein subunit POP4